MKQIDDTFVSHIDNILNHEHETELEAKQPKENGPMLSEPSPGLLKHVKWQWYVFQSCIVCL